jgi:hypothetical protein
MVFATPVKQQDISITRSCMGSSANQDVGEQIGYFYVTCPIFTGYNHHWTIIGPNKSSYWHKMCPIQA